MTFLQPMLLWGLPLALVPVLIHLFNRLRHRPMPWAAMMFLRSATRNATRHARLRQFLILLCRVLALAALILALSRPLAGGWMGWMVSGTPDAVLVLLDRSASMEAREPGRSASRRQQAIDLFQASAEAMGVADRLVLVDSATREARELTRGGSLTEDPWTRPTSTAADLPAMLQSALDWIGGNQPGSVELWMASDMQTANWRPESEHWAGMRSALARLPQSARVRLLALNRDIPGNHGIRVREVLRHRLRGLDVLDVWIEARRGGVDQTALPMTFSLDGAESQVLLKMEGPVLVHRHRVVLEDPARGGWGRVSLPADVNPMDNESVFVYGPSVPPRLAVVAEDSWARRVVAAAGAADAGDTNVVIRSAREHGLRVADNDGLVVWQAGFPEGAEADALEAHVAGGGAVLFFPPGAGPKNPSPREPGAEEPDSDASAQASGGRWQGMGWGETIVAEEETGWGVVNWNEADGPLANTEEGLRLPLDAMVTRRYRPILGEHETLATLANGAPWLTRAALGRGRVFFCATLPRPDWSELQEGAVLVPMLRRLARLGSQRLGKARMSVCGEGDLPALEQGWIRLGAGAGDAETPVEPGLNAGVYRFGEQWLALNRPEAEDDPLVMEAERARELFAGVEFQMFEERTGGTAQGRVELWRWFLGLMLALLLGEAMLILPERKGGT